MRGYEGGAESVENASTALFSVEIDGSDVGELVIWESDVESGDEEVEGLSGAVFFHWTEGGHVGLSVKSYVRWDGGGVGHFVVVRVFERSKEFLVAFDVLATIGLYASVDGTLGAFVGESLSEP